MDKFLQDYVPPHPLEPNAGALTFYLVGTPRQYIFKELSRVEYDGTQLKCINMTFHHVGYGTQALVAWLEALGCQDIEFEIFNAWDEIGKSAPPLKK